MPRLDLVTTDDDAVIGADRRRSERRQSRHVAGLQNIQNDRAADISRILSSANQGIWTIDPGGRTTFINNHMASLLGYCVDEMMGRLHTDFMWEEDRPQGDELLALRCQGIDGVWDQRYRRKDGSTLWTLASCSPLVDEEGRVLGALGLFTDITHRKQDDILLRESEQLYRAIGESIAYGVWICAPDGGNTYASDSFLRMTGLSQEQCSGFGWTRRVHPDDLAKAISTWNCCVTTKELWDCEYRIRGVDGQWHHILSRGMPVLDARDELICWAGINLDIDDLKRAEEALRNERKRLSLALLSGNMGVYEYDFINGTLWWSEETYAVFGVDPKTFSPTKAAVTAMLHPDDREPLWQRLRESIAQQGAFVHEFRIVRPDGQTRWISNRATADYDEEGHAVRHFGIAIDITGPRKTLEELVANEQRIRLATEATGAGIWEWDVSTNKIHWDNQMFTIYGLDPTPDGFVDYTVWVNAMLAEERANNENMIRNVMRSRGQGKREFRIRRTNDGECRYVESVETVRTNAKGQVAFVVGTNVDVTERNRSEHELRRLTNALSEENRRKEHFLAILGHELRNPLAPMRTAVEILQLKGPRIPELNWARHVIVRQLQTIVRLADDLIDVTRINQGRMALNIEQVELASVLQVAVESSRPSVEDMKHVLTVTLPAEAVYITCDPVRLAQVFINLLTNACKYTGNGGRIGLHAQTVGGDVVVSVTDTGIGISSDKLATIFEMFSQAEESLSCSQGGLGIGLALAKSLVEMHQGSIEVHSAGAGQGSEFSVRLPTVQAQPQSTNGPAETDDVEPSPGQRILVVDDNHDATESLAMLLEMMGNSVCVAYDGERAVAAAREFRPHIVLCDIGLPKLNGYDVCRQMKAQAWHEEMMVVAVTGWAQDEDRRRSTDAGFDFHLVKPLEPQTLTKLLATTASAKFRGLT